MHEDKPKNYMPILSWFCKNKLQCQTHYYKVAFLAIVLLNVFLPQNVAHFPCCCYLTKCAIIKFFLLFVHSKTHQVLHLF